MYLLRSNFRPQWPAFLLEGINGKPDPPPFFNEKSGQLKCLSCQTDNKPGAKFCAKCGQMAAPLVVPVTASRPCTVCQNACKPDARFCPKCGTGFDAPAPAPDVPDEVRTLAAAAQVSVAPAATADTVATEAAVAPPLPVEATVVIAPVVGVTPPEPVVAVSPTPLPTPDKAAVTPRNGKPTGLLILAAMAGIAVLAGGGYLALRPSGAPATTTSPAATVATPAPSNAAAPVVSAPVTASAPAAAPAPTPPAEIPLPAAPEPVAKTPEPVEVITEPAPAKPVPIVPAKPKPVPVAKAPPAADNGLEQVINDSLTEASQCMGRKQFDCVLANTSTVLRMAPGNRRAQDLKRQAKEAQERALSQIQIQ